MKLPRSGHGRLGLEVIELADHERPPMITIPEYLERRRQAAAAETTAATVAEPAADTATEPVTETAAELVTETAAERVAEPQ